MALTSSFLVERLQAAEVPKIFESRVLSITIIVFLPPLIFNYALQWIVYHWQHRKLRNRQIPPQYPSFIPYIGSFLSFVWHGESFLQRATSYAGKLTATKVKVLGTDVYLFQDYPSIRSIWKEQQLASPMAAYVYTLKYLCGQDTKSLAAYRADDSGPFPKPYPGTNIAPQNRVDYITHAGLLRGLTGCGLGPTTRRLSGSLDAAFEPNLYCDDEWTQMPDLLKFFQRRLGTSIMQSLFGPTLLALHSSFVDDFWEYERDVPRFAWGLPSFIIPRAYRNRERLIKHLKSWYAHARSQFTESDVDIDGDGDRLWGSELMRNRQKDLLAVEGQNDESLAAADLGLIWASVSNIVPSAMFSTFHIFAEPGLLPRVRSVLDSHRSTTSPSGFNLDSLTKDTLLLSIYAETLRMYVKTYFVACSPHKDISLGNWQLPRGKVALVNSGISHMDQGFWNTKDGEYPVHRFWPDRFITYVHDPASGPMKPAMRPGARNTMTETVQDDKGTFNLDGLQGLWIPYGGGHAICPGRFLAKNAIILSAALIADRYDIELLEDLHKLSPAKFGLGSLKPGAAIPFRIRKRNLGTKE